MKNTNNYKRKAIGKFEWWDHGEHPRKWLDDVYYPYWDGSNMSEVHQCSKCGKYKRVRKLDLSNYGVEQSIKAGLRYEE